MAKQQANQMRPGQVIEFEGRRWSVLKINIMTPGKGAAVIQGMLLNMAVAGAMLSYLLQAVSFLVLRARLPDLHRPYRSPMGIGGAIVTIAIQPDSRFTRDHDDIRTEILIPLETAVLGGRQRVPTPDGDVRGGRRHRGQAPEHVQPAGGGGPVLPSAVPRHAGIRRRFRASAAGGALAGEPIAGRPARARFRLDAARHRFHRGAE